VPVTTETALRNEIASAEMEGYRFEPETFRTDGSFPCIIHWNFNHFVVLCGFRNGYAYLNDPARGSLRVTMSEFDKSFTGICLMFSPGENFRPEGRPQSTFLFARRRLSGAGRAVVFGHLVGAALARGETLRGGKA